MTRVDFETELARDGYQLREAVIDPNTRRELHAHDYDARVLVLEGALTLVYENRQVRHEAGEECFVPAGTRHAEHTGDDGARFVVATRKP